MREATSADPHQALREGLRQAVPPGWHHALREGLRQAVPPGWHHALREGLRQAMPADRRPAWVRCRGCLGELGQGPLAGLCERCWQGLVPLPEERCARCALPHPWSPHCPEPVAWEQGEALWDYHAGHPPLGPLLVPGIKRGESGWKRALLRRLAETRLPDCLQDADVVCSVPTALVRRWSRGFDLAEDVACQLGWRLGVPMARFLRKPWFARAQAGQTESQRRRLGPGSVLVGRQPLLGETVLLVDDVWTTGTTLLRCAQALRQAGAGEVLVFALFRAGRRGGQR